MSEVIQHHGIKGMRWGVRRSDAELNAASGGSSGATAGDYKKAKSGVDQGSELVKTSKQKYQSTQQKAAEKKIKGDLSKMSDAELRDVVNRLNMEDNYKRMMTSREMEIARGEDRVGKFLDGAGAALSAASSALAIAIAIKQLQG